VSFLVGKILGTVPGDPHRDSVSHWRSTSTADQRNAPAIGVRGRERRIRWLGPCRWAEAVAEGRRRWRWPRGATVPPSQLASRSWAVRPWRDCQGARRREGLEKCLPG
jgi:hypothetical protein